MHNKTPQNLAVYDYFIMSLDSVGQESRQGTEKMTGLYNFNVWGLSGNGWELESPGGIHSYVYCSMLAVRGEPQVDSYPFHSSIGLPISHNTHLWPLRVAQLPHSMAVGLGLQSVPQS